MDDYKEVTSSLEGRLFLLASKPRRPPDNIEAFFQPRPETQAVVNSWLSLKASSINVQRAQPGSPSRESSASSGRQNAPEGIDSLLDRSSTRSTPKGPSPRASVSASGFSMTVELAEPVLHLEGFDGSHTQVHRSTVLRGLLRLDVTRRVSLRGLSLTFQAMSKTEWPESWRLRKLKKLCEESIMSHTWDFLRPEQSSGKKQARAKSYDPGVYVMNFELPLDSSIPETINLPLGSVSYHLTASALTETSSIPACCSKEVILIRIPCACSLELSEPYGVHGSQHGLRYSFGLFAKSVAIGGRVPLSMRIASIPEVSWERITVSMIEDVRYSTRDGLAQREQSRTKAILMEKRAATLQDPVRQRAVRRISTTGEKLRHAHAAAADVEKPLRRSSTASSEPEVHLLEKAILNIPSCSVIQPDTAYSCIYVRHGLVITILSRINLDETSHRNFEVQIKIPIQILTCKLTKGNTTLPEYSEMPQGSSVLEQPPECGCSGSSKRIVEMPELEEDDSMLERWSSGSTRSVWRHELPDYDE
jgi:arrestin-related trafficking adapter 3/6